MAALADNDRCVQRVEVDSTHAGERMLTPREIAEVWRVSERTVQRIFAGEPGVLKLGQRHKRLRIPEEVLERVARRLAR